MNYIYLHGFASSPQSAKAQYFADSFSKLQIPLKIPDLNQCDFSHLTITRQIQQIERNFLSTSMPVTLIGSSLGGWTAACLGEQNLQVKRLILLAPAINFLSHWLPKLGEIQLNQWQIDKYLAVYHYGAGRSLPLHYNFIIDASAYQKIQFQRQIPTLILHGCSDEVIPIQSSRDFAMAHPWVKLIELDSDHALGNVLNDLWTEIRSFCQL